MLFYNHILNLLMPFSAANIDQIETHLASHPYLSEGGLPGAEDAQIYFDLGSKFCLIFRAPQCPNSPQHLFLVFVHQQFLKRFDEEMD